MPEVMEALARFNTGFSASYGDDAVCAWAGDLIRALLDTDAEVRFATSGTAANALTLAALAAPHEAVIAHEHSHVATDETGAPGFFGSGMGVIPVAGASGRIEPAALIRALASLMRRIGRRPPPSPSPTPPSSASAIAKRNSAN
jgi:threonine aldolase